MTRPTGFTNLLEPDRQLLAYLFALFGSRTKNMIATAWEMNRFESLKLSRPSETRTMQRLGDLYGPRWLRSLSDDDVRELVETAFRPNEQYQGFLDGVDIVYERRNGEFAGSFAVLPDVVFTADGLDALYDHAREYLTRSCNVVASLVPTDVASVALFRSTMNITEQSGRFYLLAFDGSASKTIANAPTREALTLYSARRGWSIV